MKAITTLAVRKSPPALKRRARIRRGSLRRALEQSLRALPNSPQGQATIELARRYAALIDQEEGMLDVVGRPFRETLEELGLTPRARAKLPRAETQPPTLSALDALRARRDARAARAAANARAVVDDTHPLDAASGQGALARSGEPYQPSKATRGREW